MYNGLTAGHKCHRSPEIIQPFHERGTGRPELLFGNNSPHGENSTTVGIEGGSIT